MSASNPSNTTASQPPSPDIQQLVGLLGDLMPLLQRFQSQAFPQGGFASQTFEPPFQGGLQGGLGNFALANPALANPALDRQAAENFIGERQFGW